MKTKSFITILLFLITGIYSFRAGLNTVKAQTPTPASSDLQEQINSLQQQVASKVAQMNLVEKKGIIGTVTDSSDTQITLTDIKGNTRFIDVDELTNFSSPTSSSVGISDIKTGMLIGVLGIYNKDSKRILARDISVMSPFPNVVYGIAAVIDNTNYEITAVSENENKKVVEIQDITRTYSYSYATNLLTNSGFSKINQNETLIAIGYPDKSAPDKILASRIILLPDVQLSARVNLAPVLSPTIPPSTGSGVKLYPITK